MKCKTGNLQKLAALLLTAALFVLTVSVSALAAVPDRPENQYVLDSAGVISDTTEKEIISKNQKLFKDTGAQIVVVAVDFLGGQEIDDYTHDLFDSWGVGSKERNNGILLVMTIGEDNYYAQAGYGINKYFDGAKLDDLLYDNLETDFAAGDYDAGVKKFFGAVLAELDSYYADYTDEYTQKNNGQNTQQSTEFNQGGNYQEYYSTNYNSRGLFSTVIGGIFRILITVFVIFVIIAVIRSILGGGGRGGPRGGGGGGGGFWTGMFLGNMLGNNRRSRWRGPPPPPPGGFGGPRPPRGGGGFGGFGGGGGFSGGGRSSGGGGFRGGGGGFSGGGGSHGGGAGRR